ncbi:MAG: ABC transporter permease [Candidatus Saccharimonas sp.]
MILHDHIENAISSFRHNRGRNILATLGIAIGVASVVTILALSGGLRQIIDHQIVELNNNLIVVRPGAESKNLTSLAGSIAQYGYNTSTLTENDVQTIRKLPNTHAVAPIMTFSGKLTSQQTSEISTIVASTSDLMSISNLTLRNGQFLDDKGDFAVAVLGTQLSIDLFGTDQSIGQIFTLSGQRFIVGGILNRLNMPINYNNIDFDNAAIISLQAGKQLHQGQPQIQQINVQATSPHDITALAASVHTQLQKNHDNTDDFTVSHGSTIGQPTNQLFIALTQVLTVIAAISLVVGGIGIMNIMLVSVTERTREIGIRKAVGATNGTIAVQFIIESLAISLLGGILGYVLGYITAFALCSFLFFAPALNWETALTALCLSTITGVVFGLYPAIRAARKNTIESLRQYH